MIRRRRKEEKNILFLDGEMRPWAFRDPRWALRDLVICSWQKGYDTKVQTVHMTRKAQDLFLDDNDPLLLRRELWEPILKAVEWADVIVAHNGIRFDWPTLTEGFAMVGLPIPTTKRFHDTLDCRFKGKGQPRSLEALGRFYNVPIPKQHMSEFDWRPVWQLTPKGLQEGIKRCESDVLLQVEVYKAATAAGHMGRPKTVKSFR